MVLSGRELTRMTGVGISFVSRTKLRTHANWLMDNGDPGPGAQWEAPDLHDRMHKSRHILLFLCGQKGERTGCGCLDTVVTG